MVRRIYFNQVYKFDMDLELEFKKVILFLLLVVEG